MVTLILTAAGTGTRAELKENKIFYRLGEETVIEKAFNAFRKTGLIGEYVITANAADEKRVKDLFPEAKVVIGGESRTASVFNGLKAATGDVVLIHDAARPFVTEDIIRDCIESVRRFGSGIAAYPSPDTLCAASGGVITENLGKNGKYVLQTPQGFYLKDILRAYTYAQGEAPDDSTLYLKYIGKPHISKGGTHNRKLTFKSDFNTGLRVGNGYDTHRFAENRKLILCGVEIPYDKGLLGHSDADAATHAVMDALLSAAGLKDIGYYFPDTDERFKDISSILLLEKVIKLIAEKGFKPKNVTVAILAEKPKLAPHVDKMKLSLAAALGLTAESVGITVTTTEGLGFIGREEGVAAYAAALIENNFCHSE